MVGLLGASPLSGPRDIKDIEVVIVNAKAPQHPFQYEYEQMLYPTVRITAGYSTGTGVIIATTNEHEITRIDILTAAHVVEDEIIVNIELYDATVITGTVVITDTIKDLALIRVETTNSHELTQIYSARLASEKYVPYLFSPVWAVGCSLGLKPRPSFGYLTAIDSSSLVSIRGYEISAPILPGNSGGPVYDGQTYQVIGIAVWVKVYNGQLVTTMAGIVPINQIWDFLEKGKQGNCKSDDAGRQGASLCLPPGWAVLDDGLDSLCVAVPAVKLNQQRKQENNL